MNLRPYQQQCLDSIMAAFDAGHGSALAVLATGAGKTIVAAHLIQRMMERGRCLFLAHREELVNQAVHKIQAVTGIRPDVEMAATYATEGFMKNPIIVSSVQTQHRDRRRFRFDPAQFSLVIADESHHSVSASWQKVIDYFRSAGAKVLGITATPDRADKLALGKIYEHVAFEYGIREGIADGWLVPIRQQFIVCNELDYSNCRTTAGDLNGADLARVVEMEKNLHAMIDPTIRIADGRRTLFFAATVAQAERITEIANRHRQGIARCIFGHTPWADRARDIREFRQGAYPLLVNVMIASEGFDVPEIEVVAMGRATKSRALYTQMVGRGTRPLADSVDNIESADGRRAAIAASAKPSMLALDFVGNSGRHKLISTLDILGGRYPEDVVNWVRKNQESSGEQFDIDEELINREQEVKRQLAEADAKRRRGVIIRAETKSRDVDPFNWADRIASKGMPRHWFFRPATEKQRNILERYGVDPGNMTIAQASSAIDKIATQRGWKKSLERRAAVQ